MFCPRGKEEVQGCPVDFSSHSPCPAAGDDLPLARFLSSGEGAALLPKPLHDCHVLELGSGIGLVGLFAAAAGARSSTVTDLEEVRNARRGHPSLPVLRSGYTKGTCEATRRLLG